MSFISPSLIARIFKALGQNRGSHAILLLRQHTFDEPFGPDKELMRLVVKMADECLAVGDCSRAEEHYKLGLALYEACFCDRSVEALRCISGLLCIYRRDHRMHELAQLLNELDGINNALRRQYSLAQIQAV